MKEVKFSETERTLFPGTKGVFIPSLKELKELNGVKPERWPKMFSYGSPITEPYRPQPSLHEPQV